MTKELMLRTDDIYKSYSMGATKVSVLRGVDIRVSEGEFVAIIGSSGSGKSTLLHILGALDRADKGNVSFEGSKLDKMSSRGMNRFRNQTVGFVFQFYHLLEELNVLENVCVPAMAGTGVLGWLSKKALVYRRAKELLNEFGLSDRLDHKPYQLSGGERQRVAIARALINQPRLLLADEPTGNLDSRTGNGILEVFERLHRAGQTIVMVTHDERIAERADRVIVLTDGKIANGNAC